MRNFADIIAMYFERRKNMGAFHSTALDVRDQYNGDIVIPLPEMDKNERNVVANLLTRGLDQISMRSTSTQPDPEYYPVRPGYDKWEDLAGLKRKVTLGWWEANRLPIREGRQWRRFYGYGRATSVIVPNFTLGIPWWEYRDPLQTYPAPCNDPDDMTPENCIFVYHQNGKWLKDRYPDKYEYLTRHLDGTRNDNELYEIIEYVDDHEVVLGVLGSKRSYYENSIDGRATSELIRYPNKAGICPAVTPSRITLDKTMGMYDGMIGMHQTQSMLHALGVIATKRGIFKDQWVVARQGEIPRIVQMADGVKGIPGMIAGGDIKTEGLDPGYMVPQMIDRIEEYQRQEAGIPAQMTGNGPTNSRTGRASDAILSATVDFTIQEGQKTMANARMEENIRAIAVAKAYWTGKKSFFISWDGKAETADYDARELFDTDKHVVEYAYAGVDENARMIEIGQMLGLELIPKKTARKLHPLVKDADQAEHQVKVEALEQAVLTAVQTMASQPGAPIADVAYIAELVAKGETIIAAVTKGQERAQKRQAAIDAEGNPDVVPAGSPEAMPGMAAPGQGAEAAAASIAPPTDELANLGNLFSRLRQPAMTVAAERGAPQ